MPEQSPTSNSPNLVEKVLDRIPSYSEGASRRRSVAGGIILITITGLFAHLEVETPLKGISTQDLITSPVIVASVLLFAYAIGLIVEMVGEIFLVRATAGVFWGLGYPFRNVIHQNGFIQFFGRTLAFLFIVPFRLLINLVKGFLGQTAYTLPIETYLSRKARLYYHALPEKVREGIAQPIGDSAELARKVLVDEFPDIDRKWANGLIVRAKDVLAITTALVIAALLYLGGTGHLNVVVLGNNSDLKEAERSFYSEENRVRDKLDALTDQVDEKLEAQKVATGALESSSRDGLKSLQLSLRVIASNLRFSYLKTRQDMDSIIEEIPDLPSPEKEKFKALVESLKKANEFAATYRQLTAKAAFGLGISFVLVLSLSFLYIGFFVTVRNAMVGLLEGLALKDTIDRKEEPRPSNMKWNLLNIFVLNKGIYLPLIFSAIYLGILFALRFLSQLDVWIDSPPIDLKRVGSVAQHTTLLMLFYGLSFGFVLHEEHAPTKRMVTPFIILFLGSLYYLAANISGLLGSSPSRLFGIGRDQSSIISLCYGIALLILVLYFVQRLFSKERQDLWSHKWKIVILTLLILTITYKQAYSILRLLSMSPPFEFVTTLENSKAAHSLIQSIFYGSLAYFYFWIVQKLQEQKSSEENDIWEVDTDKKDCSELSESSTQSATNSSKSMDQVELDHSKEKSRETAS